MSTSVGILRFIARPIGSILPSLGIGLLATAVLFAARRPPTVDLQALDPALMKAVTASVSQRDVEAILTHRRASGPVHLQLYTSCDGPQRCTIFTTMVFPRSAFQPSTISLQVAMDVMPDGGDAQRTVTSTWQVQSIGPAIDEHIDHAGDFSGLSVLAKNREGNAIAGLLTSIRSAIAAVLVSHGVAAEPGAATATRFPLTTTPR